MSIHPLAGKSVVAYISPHVGVVPPAEAVGRPVPANGGFARTVRALGICLGDGCR